MSAGTGMSRYDYLVLYLLPKRLIHSNKMLELQWRNIETLIPCLLESLYAGKVNVKLHELDKIFTGIAKLSGQLNGNILGKAASLWYYLTRIFHQSVGPRIGNFAEELIEYWINANGNYTVMGRNIELRGALAALGILNLSKVAKKKKSEEERKLKGKADFVLKSNSGGRVALIELRMSEHTGGRTAQQSLLDKIDYVLNSLEDPEFDLKRKLVNQGIKEVDFSIAILFNEEHELLNINNFNKGRLSSLVGYIMDEKHIWGVVNHLAKNYGYKFCNGDQISKKAFENKLQSPTDRRVCIEDNRSNIKIWLKILFGDEFFQEYTGSTLADLLAKHAGMIADDIWLFYAVTINELKIAVEFGETHVKKIYDTLLDTGAFGNFISTVYRNNNLSLNEYIHRFNQWIENCAHTIVRKYREMGCELRLLETNDLIASFEYLKQLCICALGEYFARNCIDGRGFEKCSWGTKKE